jgi:hypothetical protein
MIVTILPFLGVSWAMFAFLFSYFKEPDWISKVIVDNNSNPRLSDPNTLKLMTKRHLANGLSAVYKNIALYKNATVFLASANLTGWYIIVAILDTQEVTNMAIKLMMVPLLIVIVCSLAIILVLYIITGIIKNI